VLAHWEQATLENTLTKFWPGTTPQDLDTKRKQSVEIPDSVANTLVEALEHLVVDYNILFFFCPVP